MPKHLVYAGYIARATSNDAADGFIELSVGESRLVKEFDGVVKEDMTPINPDADNYEEIVASMREARLSHPHNVAKTKAAQSYVANEQDFSARLKAVREEEKTNNGKKK